MAIISRETPKINGSSGGEYIYSRYCLIVLTKSQGFIALVVCLSVLVLGLFIAVFILLRDHLPSDEERAVRRQISRRHREQPSSTSNPFIYNSSSTTDANQESIGKKIGSMFGMNADSANSGGKRTKKGVRGGQGWVQAGSGDEWDTDSGGEGGGAQTRSLGQSLSGPSMQKQVGQDRDDIHGIRLADRSSSITKDGGPEDLPFTPPILDKNGPARYSQVESVSSSQNLVSPNPYPSSLPPSFPLRTAPTRLQTADSLTPSSPSSLHSTRLYNASPEPYHVRGGSDDLHEGHGEARQDSGGSVSIRTFHTGTKFIESLE